MGKYDESISAVGCCVQWPQEVTHTTNAGSDDRVYFRDYYATTSVA
jgi:hypothetical protein